MKQAILLPLALLIIEFASYTHSASVFPSDRVRNGVVIRAEPNSTSERLLVLAPDRSVEHVESISRYYKVRLLDGRLGFVSKSWTVLRDDVETTTQELKLHFMDVG